MGELTRDQLIDEVKAGLGRMNVASDDISIQRYVIALNAAQTRIARKHNWSELVKYEVDLVGVVGLAARDYRLIIVPTGMNTTGALNPIITLPTLPKDILQMEIFYEGRVTPITKINVRQFRRIYRFHSDLTTEDVRTGRPIAYTTYAYHGAIVGTGLLGMFVHFSRAPTSNYTLRYIVTFWPKVFEPGAVDNLIKSDLRKKDDAIIYYTLSRLLRQLGRHTDANAYFAEAESMVSDSMADDQHDPDLVIRPRQLDDGTSARGDISDDPFVHSDHGDHW